MRDFFWEDAEEIQDTGKCGWVGTQGADNVCEDILPFCHLYRQVGQTHTQRQSDGLWPSMEDGQVLHDGGTQLWQLLAGYLVKVVYNLAGLGRKHGHAPGDQRTLPLRVVAAKSFAAASTELDSSIARVVVHASCCDPFRQPM